MRWHHAKRTWTRRVFSKLFSLRASSPRSYLGERSEPRVSSRVPLAATFHDIPQMESLLAGYKLLCLFSRYLYLLVEVVVKVSIQSVLVVNLEEYERSICVWLLHLGAKISTKSFLCAFNRSDVPGKNCSVRRKLPTLACLSGRKVGKLRSKPALHKRLQYHIQLRYLFA